MKKSAFAIGAVAVVAYFLWKRANDPARVQAAGDAALTQAAALQKSGQPVPDALKAAILRAHGSQTR
jgi:hypothetical protein